MEPALTLFRERTFAPVDRELMSQGPARDPRRGEELRANATYWFEHELRQYPAIDLDLEALKANADRIVLLAGRESRGYPTYEVNVVLGKKLGRELIELPGGHIGFNSQPAEFAREFVHALGRTGHVMPLFEAHGGNTALRDAALLSEKLQGTVKRREPLERTIGALPGRDDRVRVSRGRSVKDDDRRFTIKNPLVRWAMLRAIPWLRSLMSFKWR
jgi:hypothetical protein